MLKKNLKIRPLFIKKILILWRVKTLSWEERFTFEWWGHLGYVSHWSSSDFNGC